ncbi:N-ethylmaleimide reductase [Oxalobacteraceae bacterium GrIS 1.11]
MTLNKLFTPVQIGAHTLRNRLVMAPMTRSRADEAAAPGELTQDYYRQRASAGLIITEGTFPSSMGKGYVRTPGIVDDAQVTAWRRVTDAVHAQGGLIFMQLMHCGRIAHPSMLPGNARPVAPSAVKAEGTAWTDSGPQALVEPRALTGEEVAQVVAEYAAATRQALAAGFDGVELHAASGYLPEQFLSSKTNLRADAYGGSVLNRTRFVVETLTAMVAVAGAGKVGIKISPEMNFNDIADADPVETYTSLVRQLDGLPLAYLHVALFHAATDYHSLLRPLFNGAYLVGAGLTRDSAELLLDKGQADAVVFGSLFLANPDLPKRLRLHASLNVADRDTFYSTGAQGYTDYPALLD